MATIIHFVGSPEALHVGEETKDVVKKLGAAKAGELVELKRRAAYGEPGTVEGKSVHVRVDAVAYVTPA